MNCPRYNGTVHPEVYVKEMRAYCNFRQITDEKEILKFSKMMVDSTIEISSDAESCDEFIKLLKEHSTFSILKNSSKRKLHLLRYKLEREGGDTTKFVADFRSLCRDAEITEISKQKNYLYYTLPNDFFRNEFVKGYDDIKSLNELLDYFERTLNQYSKFILNNSVVALKHVVTGRYLSSGVKHYATGSKNQMVFCGQSLRDSNSAWIIRSNSPEMLPYDNIIYLEHINTGSHLEICTNRHDKSPISGFTEVSCGSNNNYSDYTWILERGNPENKEVHLRTRDNVILKNKYPDYLTNQQKEEALRSVNVEFTVDGEKYQEVFAHSVDDINENDLWCIEIIEQEL